MDISTSSHSLATSPIPKQLPWVEKYRPANVNDIAAQEDIVNSLRNAVVSGNIPHMLFYGPPGTGKTSTILAMARDLYGPELMRSRVLELNASDERGISVVREKVKAFAMGAVGVSATNPNAPPFKLIILDEADSLTPDAQAALRRTMETYSKVTRFCILCNYVSRIIDPLVSRCSKYRFKPLSESSMLTRLQMITKAENVSATEESLREILKVSNGDMRKAITYLQSISQLQRGKGSITLEMVHECAGVIPEKFITSIMSATSVEGSFAMCKSAAMNCILSGYSTFAVLSALSTMIIKDSNLSSISKARISESIAAAEKKLIDGADEELQLFDVFLEILRQRQNFTIDASRAQQIL